jgi:hypothetical protein
LFFSFYFFFLRFLRFSLAVLGKGSSKTPTKTNPTGGLLLKTESVEPSDREDLRRGADGGTACVDIFVGNIHSGF